MPERPIAKAVEKLMEVFTVLSTLPLFSSGTVACRMAAKVALATTTHTPMMAAKRRAASKREEKANKSMANPKAIMATLAR